MIFYTYEHELNVFKMLNELIVNTKLFGNLTCLKHENNACAYLYQG